MQFVDSADLTSAGYLPLSADREAAESTFLLVGDVLRRAIADEGLDYLMGEDFRLWCTFAGADPDLLRVEITRIVNGQGRRIEPADEDERHESA